MEAAEEVEVMGTLQRSPVKAAAEQCESSGATEELSPPLTQAMFE
jgi:hypothetical protein